MGLLDWVRGPSEPELKEYVQKLEAKVQEMTHEKAVVEAARRDDSAACAYIVGDYNKQFEQIENLESEVKRAHAHLENLYCQLDKVQQESHESQRARQRAEDAAEDARTQLIKYKSSLSSATKTGSQLTDDDVKSRVNKIFYAIQGLAVTSARGAEFDANQLPGEVREWMKHHIPDAERLPKTATSYIIVALISRALVARYTPGNYFGLSSKQSIAGVNSLAQCFSALDLAGTKAWLEPTRKLLKVKDADTLHKSDEALIICPNSEEHYHDHSLRLNQLLL